MDENNAINETQTIEMIDLMNIDYDQVCRGCLSQDDDLKPMYAQLEDNIHDNIVLSDMFMECTSILINDDDNLPKQFCDNCIFQINQSYVFKKNCQRIDESLRYYEQHQKLFNDNENIINNDDLSLSSLSTTSQINAELINEHNNIDEDGNNDDNEHDIIKKELSAFDEMLIQDNVNNRRQNENSKSDENDKRKYKCDECSKMFITLSHLRSHQLIHTNERPYICTVCGKGFNSKPNLKRHNMIHTGERPYKCNICSKSFIQQVTLNDHKRVHTNETPYICKICSSESNNLSNSIAHAFKQSGELRRHIKKYHETSQNSNDKKIKVKNKILMKLKKSSNIKNDNKKSYLCCNCGKSFTSNTLLDIHMRIHTGEKPYNCMECNKSFSQISTLKTHQLIHTNRKQYECDYCKKLFRHRNALKQHILIHMGIKKYNCTYCTKHFTQSSQLNYHLRTHTGEKPYQCFICFKTFALKGNLTVHERIHTGVTPYVCTVCLKGFYDSSSLKKHQKLKHHQLINYNIDDNINTDNTDNANNIVKSENDKENTS